MRWDAMEPAWHASGCKKRADGLCSRASPEVLLMCAQEGEQKRPRAGLNNALLGGSS